MIISSAPCCNLAGSPEEPELGAEARSLSSDATWEAVRHRPAAMVAPHPAEHLPAWSRYQEAPSARRLIGTVAGPPVCHCWRTAAVETPVFGQVQRREESVATTLASGAAEGGEAGA